MTTYYVNIVNGEIRCDASPQCMGQTLTAAVETARPRQREFLGMDGIYERLSGTEVTEFRTMMRKDFDVEFVCTHEMSAALAAKRA